jgi:DNA primase
VSATGRAARRTVEISRPQKPLFPSGISKRDLASYYELVGDAMLVHLARRPLLLERYPRWTLASVPDRLQRDGDPWSEIKADPQTLTSARQHLAQALAESRERRA